MYSKEEIMERILAKIGAWISGILMIMYTSFSIHGLLDCGYWGMWDMIKDDPVLFMCGDTMTLLFMIFVYLGYFKKRAQN